MRWRGFITGLMLAATMGTVPPTLLIAADEVIE
jgi:hypothetical protein